LSSHYYRATLNWHLNAPERASNLFHRERRR